MSYPLIAPSLLADLLASPSPSLSSSLDAPTESITAKPAHAPPSMLQPGDSIEIQSKMYPDETRIYTLITKLGEGSFGKVFSCNNNTNKNKKKNKNKKIKAEKEECSTYAMKISALNAASENELDNLMAIRAQCEPYLMCMHDYGDNETKTHRFFILQLLDRPWISMTKYIDNRQIMAELDGLEPLHYENDPDRNEVVHIINQLCEGLLFLHSLQYVHLDIKEENVFCNVSDPNNVRIKYIDMGFLTKFDYQGQPCSTRKGTAYYMDDYPVIKENPKKPGTRFQYLMCPQSDYYSLGIMILNLINGFEYPEVLNGMRDAAVEQLRRENAKLEGKRKSEIDPDSFTSQEIKKALKQMYIIAFKNTNFANYMNATKYSCDFFNKNPEKRFIVAKSSFHVDAEGAKKDTSLLPAKRAAAAPPEKSQRFNLLSSLTSDSNSSSNNSSSSSHPQKKNKRNGGTKRRRMMVFKVQNKTTQKKKIKTPPRQFP